MSLRGVTMMLPIFRPTLSHLLRTFRRVLSCHLLVGIEIEYLHKKKQKQLLSKGFWDVTLVIAMLPARSR
jgi:hypothetical protein